MTVHFSGGEVGEAHSKICLRADPTASPNRSATAWYAVQTLYRHEQRVSDNLGMKGFTTYLPLLRETRQWSDRKKVIDVPAFGGYVFVRHDSSAPSRVRVLETMGVVRLLGDSRTPVSIPDVEIESLRRTLQSNIPCEKCEYIAIGTMVQVKRGVLTGVRGRLIRNNNRLRMVLSVSTVSQAVSVEASLEDVEPVAEIPGAGQPQRGMEAASFEA
jgi:transcription termination/antitermination protein NusG